MTEDSPKHYDAGKILNALFLRARERDEFEYICALSGLDMLCHRVNTLAETWALFRDVVGLLYAPLITETRLRLSLLLYCHLIEAKPIYAMLDNMLSIAGGERCAMDPFFDLCRPKKKDAFVKEFIPPSAKTVFRTLLEHARAVDEHALAEMLESIFDDGLRNAFFHADYCILGDRIQSRHSWFEEDGARRQSVACEAVFEKVQRSFTFYQAFESVYIQHRLSYQEPKKIRGRFGPNDSYKDIYVYVDPNGGGLAGIGSTPEGPPRRGAGQQA